VEPGEETPAAAVAAPPAHELALGEVLG